MNVLLSDIPGLDAALEDAARDVDYLREIAFLDVNQKLCNVEVRQFRPRHSQLLSIGKNPFVIGGEITTLACAHFLWIVSAEFSADRVAAAAFAEDHAFQDSELPELAAEISEYIADAFMDRRPSRKTASAPAPKVCGSASIIHDIAAAYGWSRETILDTPYGALFQSVRLIDADSYAAAGMRPPPPFSRLDKLRAKLVREHLQTLETPKPKRRRKK